MFIIIVFWLGCDRPSGLFFCARFASFHTHTSLLSSSVSLSYFMLAVTMREFGKTLVHEFPISYNHPEWYFIFSLFCVRETNMSSGQYYRHCSWSARSNHLIKKSWTHTPWPICKPPVSWFSVVGLLLRFTPTASCNRNPPLSRW